MIFCVWRFGLRRKRKLSDAEEFLDALIKMSFQPNVQTMIEREARRRLSGYEYFQDAKPRRENCISEKSEFFMYQFKSPLGHMARKKIAKWKKYGDAYLYWCWRNAAINFFHSTLKNGELIDEAFSTKLDSEYSTKAQLDNKMDYLESFLDYSKHSEAKIQCFLDRLNGMSFPQMMKEYEPQNWAKDRKGQKYYRRFTRFVSQELGLKREVDEYLQLIQSTSKSKELKIDMLLSLKSSIYSAKAKLTTEGFIVFSGAAGNQKQSNSLPIRYEKVRSNLILKGVLVLSGNKLQLTEDTIFSSPTQASSILLGCPCNGLDYWLEDNEKTRYQIN